MNVTGDEVENGVRPKPFMLYKNLDLLDVPDLHSVVKVGRTMWAKLSVVVAFSYAFPYEILCFFGKQNKTKKCQV